MSAAGLLLDLEHHAQRIAKSGLCPTVGEREARLGRARVAAVYEYAIIGGAPWLIDTYEGWAFAHQIKTGEQ